MIKICLVLYLYTAQVWVTAKFGPDCDLQLCQPQVLAAWANMKIYIATSTTSSCSLYMAYTGSTLEHRVVLFCPYGFARVQETDMLHWMKIDRVCSMLMVMGGAFCVWLPLPSPMSMRIKQNDVLRVSACWLT